MAAIGTVGVMVAGVSFAQTAQAAPRSTTALAGSQPSFVAHSKDLGAVSGSRAVDFEIVLGLPDQAAVEAEAEALSTPGSASYHRFLTPAQFRAAYSPSAATVAAVESWVRGAGLTVKAVAPSRLYVEVTGTMSRAEKLVGTRLDTFAYKNQQLAEPVASYRIPAGLSGKVAGVISLDDSGMIHKGSTGTSTAATTTAPSTAIPAATLPGPPPGATYGVQPCSAYYGQVVANSKPKAYGRHWPYTICGYDADQYEKAFGLYNGIQKGLDGKGVTVAITDAFAAPTILSDANKWSVQNHLAPLAKGQFTQVVPPANGYNGVIACDPQGWYGEETLDVEAVHATAPGAKILYAGGSNCSGGLDTAWANVIDKHLASIETDSWTYGDEAEAPVAEIDFYHEYLLEAATTGVTVLFSSGDDGDEVASTGTKQVELPASDPFATAVGGTSTEIGKTGNIVFQAGWSNDYSEQVGKTWQPNPPGAFSSGAGGGTSVLYKQPFYQVGVVPKSISEYFGKTPMRAVPDVAMPADPNTGLRVGETQTFANGTYYATYRIGGTSLSSPLFAGVVADAEQYRGSAIGFINPLLYKDIDTPAITDVVNPSHPEATVRTNLSDPTDVTSPLYWLLQTIGVATTIHAGRGYDDQTGVGTPNGLAFFKAMSL